MRAVVIMSLAVLLHPAAAMAQGAPPAPPANAARGGDITRDDYIEAAKQRAGARFDKADANRDGVLSADERRAARPKRRAATPQ